VILLDLLMTNVDGFEVLAALGSAVPRRWSSVITGADRSLLRHLDPLKITGW